MFTGLSLSSGKQDWNYQMSVAFVFIFEDKRLFLWRKMLVRLHSLLLRNFFPLPIPMSAEVQPHTAPSLSPRFHWVSLRYHRTGLIPILWNQKLHQNKKYPKKKTTFSQEIVQVACDPKQFPLFLAKAGYRSTFPNAAMFIALAWWFTKYRMCPVILCIFPILFHKLQLHKYSNTFFLCCPLKFILRKAIWLEQ